jgi:hypothetical protein
VSEVWSSLIFGSFFGWQVKVDSNRSPITIIEIIVVDGKWISPRSGVFTAANTAVISISVRLDFLINGYNTDKYLETEETRSLFGLVAPSDEYEENGPILRVQVTRWFGGVAGGGGRGLNSMFSAGTNHDSGSFPAVRHKSRGAKEAHFQGGRGRRQRSEASHIETS